MYMICVNVKQEGFNRSNPLILFFNDLRQIFWCKKKKEKKNKKRNEIYSCRNFRWQSLLVHVTLPRRYPTR